MKNSRIEFTKLCQAFIAPMQAVLDHPLMPTTAAQQISDALLEVADRLRPGMSNSAWATRALKEMAGFTEAEEEGREDEAPPAWVAPLCAAMAEALADQRLPNNVHSAFASLITDLDNNYCHDFQTMAKTTLPVSLNRACGFEPTAEKGESS
jgi:hypothetical protein